MSGQPPVAAGEFRNKNQHWKSNAMSRRTLSRLSRTPRLRTALQRHLLPALSCVFAMGLAALPAVATASVTPAAAPGQRHAISYDRYSLKIDGKRIYLWSGSFHYWRLPSPDLWVDVLQKMKAAGFNAVEIYFDWGYHSARRGVYDFSGIRDVDRLLDDARDAGLYVIARPGPYINAETDGGGFPAWLSTIKGHVRTTDPDYTAAYREWLGQIDRILARHQLSNGTGTVLLYQVENEFYHDTPDGRRYMQDIERKARADGISVPLIGNHNGSFASGVGAVDMPGYDSYPLGLDCSHPEHWSDLYDFSPERRALTRTPLFFPELQGGSFDVWGGTGYAQCRRLTGVAFERVYYEGAIASGSTMQNFYMTYGGFNWGWLGSPGLYTSYDYGAAIDASRRLTAKYGQQKLLGYFTQSVHPLTKTRRMAIRPPEDTALRLDGRVNPDDGTRFYVLRHADATSTADDATHLWLDLSAGGASAAARAASGAYLRVPQQPGTAIRIDGRDSKILLANYRFGGQRLVYSTSEWMTGLDQGRREIAVLYGRRGEDGETVLAYPARPAVRVLAGKVAVAWDPAHGGLRLNYRHDGLARVQIDQGGRSLLLLIGDRQAAQRFWKLDTAAGPVLVDGPYLLRTAAQDGTGTLALSGDTDRATPLEVFAPAGAKAVSWNGQAVPVRPSASGSLLGRLAGPAPVSLPALDAWKHRAGAPEIQPGYDDASWPAADRKRSDNPYWDGRLPILDSDEYGFHYGNVWYRGHFTASGREKGIILSASLGVHLGNHGVFTVWLNGHYLGRNPSGARYFAFDRAELKPGGDNVLSVLVDNMGHNQEERPDASKEPRGLSSATLLGSSEPIAWCLRGDRGGERIADPVRGPFNNGGLYGERHGWSLPGYPDGGWQPATLPRRTTRAGVDWYRTRFTLDLPTGQDVPIGLKIDDAPSHHYRALIFVNGWQFGRYINAVGPQHVFELPPGILNPHGSNTIAIASWSTGDDGGLGKVSLVALGNYRSALQVRPVDSPGYARVFGAQGGDVAKPHAVRSK